MAFWIARHDTSAAHRRLEMADLAGRRGHQCDHRAVMLVTGAAPGIGCEPALLLARANFCAFGATGGGDLASWPRVMLLDAADETSAKQAARSCDHRKSPKHEASAASMPLGRGRSRLESRPAADWLIGAALDASSARARIESRHGEIARRQAAELPAPGDSPGRKRGATAASTRHEAPALMSGSTISGLSAGITQPPSPAWRHTPQAPCVRWRRPR
jgi:NAD(P)-dependent dehydrogenase (short-subunit alcohol dehydrogenase family)